MGRKKNAARVCTPEEEKILAAVALMAEAAERAESHDKHDLEVFDASVRDVLDAYYEGLDALDGRA